MFNKIVGTFFTRIIVMMVMLVVVVINTNTFGAEGTGTIALVVLGLTILQLLSNMVGGGAIVYLVPRKSFSQILVLTYAWSLLSNIAGTAALFYLRLIPDGFEWQLFILSVINSLYFINTTLMQGKDNIRLYNLYHLFQTATLIVGFLAVLGAAIYLDRPVHVDLYIFALTLSYLVPLLCSFGFIKKNVNRFNMSGLWDLLKEMFQLGFWVQLANLAQLMNYRLNYYFIEYFAGRKPLGIFELGTKLSEAVWVFPKSMALVQYAKLSNTPDQVYAKKLTTSFFKMVLLFSLVAVIILLVIPSGVFAFVFGPEFIEVKKVIYALAPGIVFLSCLTIFSHHFSGFGLYWINTVSSLLGLVVTLVLGIILIPEAVKSGYMEALQTAGIITSLSYLSSFIFSAVFFFKKTDATWKDFLFGKSDYRLLKNEFSVFREKFSSKK